jgi:long-chain acyl-CoA synthetase
VIELFSLYSGAQVSFLESLDMFAEQLAEVAPTRFAAVPPVWGRIQQRILKKIPQKKLDRLLGIPIVSGMIRKKILKGLDLQNSKLNVTGAAGIPEATLHWFKKLGITLLQGYGMTENCAHVSVNLVRFRRQGAARMRDPDLRRRRDPHA